MQKGLYFFICSAIIVLILSGGCGKTEIDSDIRVLVKGKVLDQANNPVVNANIQVFTDASGLGSLSALLGEGFSDESGNFNVTSLFGENSLFYIDVFVDDQYATYRYQTNTVDYAPSDLVFDLQTVELTQVAVFNYNIIRESGDDNTLEFSFRYINPSCQEVYEAGNLNEIQSDCYTERLSSGSLNNTTPDAEDRILFVPFQSQIEFTYSINGDSPIIEIIDINTLDYEFEFNY